ncbi:ras-interacting protein RIP3 [Sitodiplosis mosellana]|uniref:ras-interacting protein RIP3 n=1 Tax=Sitodiplosis mosellana TaxID=263140 RepID=UPI002443E52A|nr:ras-interacting protein RIP3 [Sitodiplosis mosellana]XP_055319668.1 ras-interacting protein RIP3 [Sitodiplosis mosellana]XP_055319669.1 ras-interacting protein RIP3 [Sitodiplosis mosellana]
MSNLPSYSATRLMTESDESISLRNNNVTSHQQQEAQQQQQQQQKQLQQQQQQQPQIPYHDPPYLIRNSRAFRHFKNPPQPHMCIKDHTDDGQELFINVMSWTKICMPHSETDPIPLYGGMRVTSGSPKSPLMFAVMANPAILKHVGRKCSDAEEKLALVKLMCDFVEAMNPGLKLARAAEVLKDRDLSGELKDIWGAVQAKRLREKDSAPSYESYLASQNQVYIDFGPPEAPPYQSERVADQQQQQQQQQQSPPSIKSNKDSHNHSNSVLNVDEVDNNIPQQILDSHQNNLNTLDNNTQIAMTNNRNITTQHKEMNVIKPLTSPPPPPTETATTVAVTTITMTTTIPTPTGDSDSNKNDRQLTKKDKLSGFLPNSCHNIFPFIKTKSSSHDKNNAHKEKNDTNQKDAMQQQQHQSNNITRKILHSSKDSNNKLIQNKDTANLESEISKLDIGKSQ